MADRRAEFRVLAERARSGDDAARAALHSWGVSSCPDGIATSASIEAFVDLRGIA
jgi:hypothetical protein